MDDGRIEIWERVRFDGSKAVAWDKSLDFGKTWESVDWSLYGNPPFVLFNPTGETVEVIESRWIPK